MQTGQPNTADQAGSIQSDDKIPSAEFAAERWSPVSTPATGSIRALRSVGMETDAHPIAWIRICSPPYHGLTFRVFAEKPEMRFDLMLGHEMRLRVTPGVIRKASPLGRLTNQSLKRGDEAGLILIGDQTSRAARFKAFPDAHDVISHRRKAMKLGFDQEIRKRFALRGQHRDVGREVKRRGIGLISEKFYACGDAQIVSQALAFFSRGTFPGEPELPVEVTGKFRADFNEFPLIFFRPEHRDVEQHHRALIGAVEAAQ